MNEKDIKQSKRIILSGLKKQENENKLSEFQRKYLLDYIFINLRKFIDFIVRGM